MSDILLAGDFYVGRGLRPGVDESVREVIRSAKHALVSFEAPITDTRDRIEETGPHLTMPVSSIDDLRSLGFTALALANSHILDAGVAGLAATLRIAGKRGLLTVGGTAEAGGARSAAKARLPLSEGSLTVLNYCEHEWSVREDGAGASGWDVLDAYSDIRQAQKDGDRVLVVLHGGTEYFPLPRPGLRKELRFLADSGADAIVMHHSHVPAAYEVWNHVPIFYGLGNFQFTVPNNHGAWREGLLLNLTFPTKASTKFDIVPIRQSEQFDVRLGSPTEMEESINELEGYRLQVASDDALLASWKEFTNTANRTFVEEVLSLSKLRPRKLRRVMEVSYSRIFLGDLRAQEAAFKYLRCEPYYEARRTSLRGPP